MTVDPSERHPDDDDGGRPSATADGRAPVMAVESIRKTYQDHSRRRRRGGPAGDDSDDSGSVVWALDRVSMAIQPGEVLGLVGQSGSGKSTLAQCLGGLTAVDDGQVLVDGQVVGGPGQRARVPRVRGVQMAFQDPTSTLNPRRRIGSVLAEILTVHRMCPRREVEDRVTGLLARVGLPERVMGQRPAALSGGMCQRVALARAMALEPRLLIADEIVSALDASVQAQILNLVLELRETTDLSVLFVTHDLAVVSQVCDRVIVLTEGRVVEEGATRQVLDNPSHPYTRGLIDAIPTLPVRVA
jgi:peptide/nickel transport system ATP-binding protein